MPGYNLKGTGITKWAWTMRYQSGWTTLSEEPHSLPYLEGAYGYGYEPGTVSPVYEQELELLAQSNDGPGNGPGGK